MLVDTDVLIWHLRGLPAATQRLDSLGAALCISAVTWLELLQGMRNGRELAAVRRSLENRQVQRLALTPTITDRAVHLMENLTLSHGLQMADALIAATALEHGLAVFTGNGKHFAPVPGLVVEPFVLR